MYIYVCVCVCVCIYIYICFAFVGLDIKPQSCFKASSRNSRKTRIIIIIIFCSFCLSVRPSVLRYRFGSHWTHLCQILMWKAFTRFCGENSKFLLKWDGNVGHFIGRPEYVYIVDGSAKCFVAPQECKCRVSLAAFNSVILTATYAAQQYCFGSATTVTRTRHGVMSHVHCLSGLLVTVFNASCDRFGLVHVLNPKGKGKKLQV